MIAWSSDSCRSRAAARAFAIAGPTSARNAGPACGHHNRWRTRGYRTWRDPDGHWHHYRPDGTEIGWRAAMPVADHWDLAALERWAAAQDKAGTP